MRSACKISVGGDELDAFHSGVNHAVDGVATAATHANYFDLGVVAGFFVKADANIRIFFHVNHRV